MKEYIEREAAIEAVQKYAEKTRTGGYTGPCAAAMMLIDEIPAAPVREVVTCWECKHGEQFFHNGHPLVACYRGLKDETLFYKPDWFCANGERPETRAEEGEQHD